MRHWRLRGKAQQAALAAWFVREIEPRTINWWVRNVYRVWMRKLEMCTEFG